MDFSNATILCLGDIMLDRFAYCATERISPEAPVPVLLLLRTQSMLGGVGNVARNIAALGGKSVLMGLLGQDQAGEEVRNLMSQTAGIVDAHVAVSFPNDYRLGLDTPYADLTQLLRPRLPLRLRFDAVEQFAQS